jgi:hypothetical protein
MPDPVSYLEIIKYLHRDEYNSNPPEFNAKLAKLERLDVVFGEDAWLQETSNAKLFITYLFVKFNWVVHAAVMGNPDMAHITDLQIKLSNVKGKFKNNLLNQYTEMLYALMSGITLYYADKSNEALAEFNRSMGRILIQAADWWQHDYNDEYMKSHAPQEFLDRKLKTCDSSSCGPCSPVVSSKRNDSEHSCNCDGENGCEDCGC